MLALQVLAVLLLFMPLLWYLWRQRGADEPAELWPEIGEGLGLAFAEEPPSLAGSWRGREAALVAEKGRAVARARFAARRPMRLEIGPRAELEVAAGIIVHDRLELPGAPEFSARFLVRSTPPELAARLLDHALRRRLLALEGVHVLAEGGCVDASVPAVTDEDRARELLDLAVAVADAAEQP